jgi:hypothetical protein
MSKQGKPQVQTTTTKIDPAISRKWNELYGMSGGFMQGAMGVDPSQRFVGMSADELAAGQGYRGLSMLNPAAQGAMDWLGGYQGFGVDPVTAAQANLSQASLGGEGSMWDRMMGADPISVAAAKAREAQRSEVRDVTAQQGSEFMSAYYNPYEDQVVQGALGDLSRATDVEQTKNAAAAAAAGAFGGGRHGLVESETTRNYLSRAAQTAGQLRHQGFTTAANLGMTDASRSLQAGGMNQGADVSIAGMAQNARIANAQAQTQANIAAANLQAQREAQMLGLEGQYGMFNAGQANQMGMFNVGQANQVGLANAGNQLAAAGLGIQAAGTMGQLGLAQRDQQMSNYDRMMAFGGLQRGIDQSRADFSYNRPMDLLSWRANILGGMPTGSTTTTKVPTQKSPLAGAAGGAMAGAAFGPWGAAIGGGIGLLGSLF